MLVSLNIVSVCQPLLFFLDLGQRNTTKHRMEGLKFAADKSLFEKIKAGNINLNNYVNIIDIE